MLELVVEALGINSIQVEITPMAEPYFPNESRYVKLEKRKLYGKTKNVCSF